MSRVEEHEGIDGLQASLRPYKVVNDRDACPPCFVIRIHEKSRPTFERVVCRKAGETDWTFWDRTLDIVAGMTAIASKRTQGDPLHKASRFKIVLHADHSGIPNSLETRREEFIRLLWEFATGDNIVLRLYALGALADYYFDD